MQRQVATLPESMSELCLIRVGIQVKRWSALGYVRGLARAIDAAATVAIRDRTGLLRSERLGSSLWEVNILQYWESFEKLEAWTRRPPHSDWWRRATERARTKSDFGLFHEAYVVPRSNIESIYLNATPIGLATFGILADATGPRTTARDRLGLRKTLQG